MPVNREIRGTVPDYVGEMWRRYNKAIRDYNRQEAGERDALIFNMGAVYALRMVGVLPVDEDFVGEDAELLGVDLWRFA